MTTNETLREALVNAICVQVTRLVSYGCACDLRNGYVCGIHKLGDEVKTNIIALLAAPDLERQAAKGKG